MVFSFLRQCIIQSDNTMRGTCFSTSECTNRGGTGDGNCAAGKLKVVLIIFFSSRCFLWLFTFE